MHAVHIPMTPAFTSPPLPWSTRPISSHRPPTCTLRLPHPSRRQVLVALTISPLLAPGSSLADRTGKYSTKLTAKRRYLPRISRGVSALSAILASLSGTSSRDWAADVASFVENDAPDLQTAMQLFSTTYFSEGNRIGPTERALGQCIDDTFDAVQGVKMAARSGERDTARMLAEKAVAAANRYVEIAKVEEAIPAIPPL